jgi:hypothetical protein
LATDKYKTRDNSKKPANFSPQKKSPVKVPTKKLTKAQRARLNELLAKTPPLDKLDPRIYTKLQSTIHEATEKTIPEYKQWLNSVLDKQIIAEDCPTPICDCNTCPTPICDCNTCPTPICDCNKCPTPIDQFVDQIANVAISSAMTSAINYALTEAWLKEAGITVSEAEMRNMVKKQVIKTVKEIGKKT